MPWLFAIVTKGANTFECIFLFISPFWLQSISFMHSLFILLLCLPLYEQMKQPSKLLVSSSWIGNVPTRASWGSTLAIPTSGNWHSTNFHPSWSMLSLMCRWCRKILLPSIIFCNPILMSNLTNWEHRGTQRCKSHHNTPASSSHLQYEPFPPFILQPICLEIIWCVALPFLVRKKKWDRGNVIMCLTKLFMMWANMKSHMCGKVCRW